MCDRRVDSIRRLFCEIERGAVAMAVVVSLLACTSSRETSGDTWRRNFIKSPNRVWTAIEVSLTELDYEIVDKNRNDGKIRAESSPADDGTVIVLTIDQVMRVSDHVSVYVKPTFFDGPESADPELLRAAAEGFLKLLDSELNG